MRRVNWLMLTAAVFVAAGPAEAGFVNPGFEVGNFTGWTVGGMNGGAGVAADGAVIAGTYPDFGPMAVTTRSGTHAAYVVAGNSLGDHLWLSQGVGLAAGTYEVGFHVGTDRLDESDFFGGAGNEIYVGGDLLFASTSSMTIPGNRTFRKFSATFTTLGGLTDIKFRVSGSAQRALFSIDDAFITAQTPTVPEPGTLALMSLGGIGLVGGAFRRRRGRRLRS